MAYELIVEYISVLNLVTTVFFAFSNSKKAEKALGTKKSIY